MDKEINYYEILGIKREELEFVYKKDSEGLIDIAKREKRSPHSKDEFVKKAYNERIAFIEYLRNQANNSRNLRQMDKAIEKLNMAYEVLGKESSRELYKKQPMIFLIFQRKI